MTYAAADLPVELPVIGVRWTLGARARGDEVAVPGGDSLRWIAANQHTAYAIEIGSDFFGEMARLRAARVIAGPDVWLHAATTRGSGDPAMNIVRGTTQALAAILGGADSVEVAPFDDSPLAARLAGNTLRILHHEARIADAARGCWAVEAMTAKLVEEARR